nr:vegetative cell wall protein gp1-like [Camelus dromedarius]
MGREASSGTQSQEPANRAPRPESGSASPRVPAPGPPPAPRRPGSLPPSGGVCGEPQRRDRDQEWRDGEHWLESGPFHPPLVIFGVPGEHVPPSLPSPPPRRPRAPPAVSRFWGALPREAYPAAPTPRLGKPAPRGVQVGPGLGVARRAGDQTARQGAAGPGTPPRTGDGTAPQRAQRWKNPVGRESREWPPICQ